MPTDVEIYWGHLAALQARDAEIDRLRMALKIIADHSGIASDFPGDAEGLKAFAHDALKLTN